MAMKACGPWRTWCGPSWLHHNILVLSHIPLLLCEVTVLDSGQKLDRSPKHCTVTSSCKEALTTRNIQKEGDRSRYAVLSIAE